MLIAFTRMSRATIRGTDGDLGTMKDLIFDGDSWDVRYVTIDTGNWLPGREVPLQPTVLNRKEWGNNLAAAPISQAVVESSPITDFTQPVSRQMEIELAKHYQWPTFGMGDVMMGVPPTPPRSAVPKATQERIEQTRGKLRSGIEVLGYRIDALDGQIGTIADLIVDDESWMIRYLVIDTGNWLRGKKVLVATTWVQAISWTSRLMSVDLDRNQINDSPAYDSRQVVNRQLEERLYDFHGRPMHTY